MVGDEAQLYERHAIQLERIVARAVDAPRELVEDACQHAWAKFLQHSDEIDHDRALSWLAVTAVRRARRLLEREGREDSLEVDVQRGREPVDHVWGVDPAFVAQCRAQLEQLEALPERDRRTMWLQGVGLSHAEIAARTGESARAVERRLRRARSALVSGDAIVGEMTTRELSTPVATPIAPTDQRYCCGDAGRLGDRLRSNAPDPQRWKARALFVSKPGVRKNNNEWWVAWRMRRGRLADML